MTPSQWVLVVFGTLVALAVGSFLCVVIERLPVELDEPNDYGDSYDTRPWAEVLGGSSRCSSCGEPIRASDKIPVLSWFLLRGKCRGCGDRIPGFHPVAEFLVPLLFLSAAGVVGMDWRILPLLGLIPAGVAVSAIDIRTLIVPTRIVWPTLGLVVVLSVLSAAIDGQWMWLRTALVCLASLAGPLFILWFLMPRGMGFGDVRLAVLLGWTVGFYGGVEPVAGVILALFVLFGASVLGIIVGVVALGARGRKAKVPWGPSLFAASLVAIALAEPLLDGFGVWSLR